ncbi:DUF1489 domain-containing protein [Aliiroseovarius subalbicans]|uniref:DUF1489 family protein n=1 Tax=Aliiroseovarius subalbicans TaxID=2925840 RepID=UPI001F5624D2|nr:DUF1489 domain-containing protein [uncultured Aliiroseovarius sp.]MCI2400592.1 DUF1489 domain-containing protein [Aliiroseovarius subalbicans]
MGNPIHLVKLCVGADSVEDLETWQAARRAAGTEPLSRHVTRMWPKQDAALLDGGSLYWVIKGMILARQRILRLDEVIGEDGIRRCGIVMEPEVIRTQGVPRRPFQGWRYLKDGDVPGDLTRAKPDEDALPHELSAALADIGIR